MSTKFPYQSHKVDVLGYKMHYISEGKGNPVVFVHGIPTSSYLWRQVIPFVAKRNRVIAPDLIGMGQSDRPAIAYTTQDYIQYFEGFIDQLNLKDITLVMHGWGSVIGLDYAMRHEANINSLVFMEPYLRVETGTESMPLPLCELVAKFRHYWQEITAKQDFIEQFFRMIMPADLPEAVRKIYQESFREIGQQLFWQHLQELPFGENSDSKIKDLINNYSEKLQQSDLPKLLVYGVPGFNISMNTVMWAKENIKKLNTVDLGSGSHYIPETHGEIIGQKIATWCATLDLVQALKNMDATKPQLNCER